MKKLVCQVLDEIAAKYVDITSNKSQGMVAIPRNCVKKEIQVNNKFVFKIPGGDVVTSNRAIEVAKKPITKSIGMEWAGEFVLT